MCVAGINKPVRLYRFNDVCCESRGPGYAHYPIAELNVRTKPTSACFNPYLQYRLVISDAEGGVMIMDTNTQHDVMQLEEHGSRTVLPMEADSSWAGSCSEESTAHTRLPCSSSCITSCCVLVSCLLYTSPSPRDRQKSRMPSSA